MARGVDVLAALPVYTHALITPQHFLHQPVNKLSDRINATQVVVQSSSRRRSWLRCTWIWWHHLSWLHDALLLETAKNSSQLLARTGINGELLKDTVGPIQKAGPLLSCDV